jgi:hypothetical protein
MDHAFETRWSDAAWLTFDRLSIDVQAGFRKQLPELVAKYAKLYAGKLIDSISIGTVSHIQPGRRCGARLEHVAADGYRLLS